LFAHAANVVVVDYVVEIIVVSFVLVVVVVVDVMDDVVATAAAAAVNANAHIAAFDVPVVAVAVVDVTLSLNAAIFVDRSVAEFVRVAVVRHHPYCYYAAAAAAMDADSENVVVETWADEEVTIKKT